MENKEQEEKEIKNRRFTEKLSDMRVGKAFEENDLTKAEIRATPLFAPKKNKKPEM